MIAWLGTFKSEAAEGYFRARISLGFFVFIVDLRYLRLFTFVIKEI